MCVQPKRSMNVRINITDKHILWARMCLFMCRCVFVVVLPALRDEAAVFRSSYLDASPSVVEQCWEMERGGSEMGGLAVLVSSLLPSGLPETYRTLSKGINSNNKNNPLQHYHKVITTTVLF